MGANLSKVVRLCVVVLLGIVLALNGSAKDDASKMASLQGKVFMIDKDSSTITVDTKGGVRRLVVYSADTKFKYGHSSKGKDSSSEQVKETNYISCTGAYDEKMRFVAKECVHRESK